MTTRITSQTMARGVLADVAQASRRLSLTQQRLSSGKDLTRPSDNPPAVARALELRAEMEATQQYQRNVDEAQGWQEVTDSALTTIGDALQRARELVVQAASDSAGTTARAGIATELRGLVDSIKQAGNATYGGRFIFAGTRTDVRPYEMGASDAYAGDAGQITRQVNRGVTLPINVTGPSVVGNDTSGLLATLRSAIAHLDGGTDADHTALRREDLAALNDRLDEISAMRATVGATGGRLEVAAGRLAEYEGSTLKLLSDTEDTDIAKAMVDFSVQQAALQASLKAGASIVQNSLLDFLR